MPSPIEIYGSRKSQVSLENPSIELLFKTLPYGPNSNEHGVRADIEAALPPTYTMTSAFFGTITLVLQSYEVDERDGNGIWTGTATYGRRQPRKTGECWMSFDGTGGQAHITTSIQTIKGYSELGDWDTDDNIEDFESAIGVNGQGAVEGTDKTISVFKFILEYYPPTAQMTADYIRTLKSLVGKVNQAEFCMFDVGECLFVGPTGQPRGFDDWELRLHFIQSDNVPDLKVGQIENIVKGGWDYLWITFKQELDDNSKYIPTRPEFAYVEQIYLPDDFTQFGLPAMIQGIAP